MYRDVELLCILAEREGYDKYADYIKDYTVLSETATLIEDFGEWYKDNKDEAALDWGSFKTWLIVVRHPTWKPQQRDVYDTILDNIEKQAKRGGASKAVVQRFVELDYATQIAESCNRLITGGGTTSTVAADLFADIQGHLSGYQAATTNDGKGTEFISLEAGALLDATVGGPGFKWRLEELNRSVGQLRAGRLCIVGKRPEVGGTSFLCSELTHMVKDLPDDKQILLVHNEEQGDMVGLRLIEAALGVTQADIVADPMAADAEMSKFLGTHRIDLLHDTSITTRGIERHLSAGEYSILGINVLSKLQIRTKEEGVERLALIGAWCRDMASRYGVAVVAITQADASAEGERWLHQAQLYGSKTALQGEADILLMIGKTHDPGNEDRRFISVVKNKTGGDSGTDPALSHGRFQVGFDALRSRFQSLGGSGSHMGEDGASVDAEILEKMMGLMKNGTTD